ncbi:thermonuclease family protein [Bradyrhizobium sp. 2]|uniref:thermonuclease family protein n=1 Tax=unclassified Bradyrhizobium TaxID=2631580 RepID=UPI001FFB6CF6|nr:thermonuclease family protein [Bradyrhizobium sp. 2]MCK1462956.1 thermonuclease family protein [Bradyrhizobium sp. 2]
MTLISLNFQRLTPSVGSDSGADILVRRAQLINAALSLVALLNGNDAGAVTEFKGIPRIIDGDTIQFGDAKLQLNGIDAPQLDQLCLDSKGSRLKCGVQARERLITQSGGRSWACTAVRQTSSGLLFGHCQVNGNDIARQMVQSGWAIASTTGSTTYLDSEAAARASKSGVWSGAFIAPIDWRQHNWHANILGAASVDQIDTAQLLSSAFGSAPPSPDCAIKGNVNTEGKCIFHRPGGRWYKRITMEAKRGDRWFCSASEAISSGCRETRR